MNESVWELVHEYGKGCEVYVDKSSLTVSGDIVRAYIRHYLVPPGVDKRNQKPVREIGFDKEFDLEKGHARYHAMTFTYVDGSVAEPLPTQAQWEDADKGSLAELNYIRSLITPNKRRWRLF